MNPEPETRNPKVKLGVPKQAYSRDRAAMFNISIPDAPPPHVETVYPRTVPSLTGAQIAVSLAHADPFLLLANFSATIWCMPAPTPPTP